MEKAPYSLPAGNPERLSVFAPTEAPSLHLAAYLSNAGGFDVNAYVVALPSRPARDAAPQRAERAAAALVRRRPVALTGATQTRPSEASLALAFFALRQRMQASGAWGQLYGTDCATPLGVSWRVTCARVACAIGGIEYASHAARNAATQPYGADAIASLAELKEAAYRDVHLFSCVVADSNCRLWAMAAAQRLVARGIQRADDPDIVQALDLAHLDPRAGAIVEVCQPFNDSLQARGISLPHAWLKWLELQKTVFALQREQTQQWLRHGQPLTASPPSRDNA